MSIMSGDILYGNDIIPAPSGFIHLNDIKNGDIIYGNDGKPVEVSMVIRSDDEDIYEIFFSEGYSIKCGLYNTFTTLDSNGVLLRDITVSEMIKQGVVSPTGVRNFKVITSPLLAELGNTVYTPEEKVEKLLSEDVKFDESIITGVINNRRDTLNLLFNNDDGVVVTSNPDAVRMINYMAESCGATISATVDNKVYTLRWFNSIFTISSLTISGIEKCDKTNVVGISVNNRDNKLVGPGFIVMNGYSV